MLSMSGDMFLFFVLKSSCELLIVHVCCGILFHSPHIVVLLYNVTKITFVLSYFIMLDLYDNDVLCVQVITVAKC